jgi:hypothetical protein
MGRRLVLGTVNVSGTLPGRCVQRIVSQRASKSANLIFLFGKSAEIRVPEAQRPPGD